ncbi:MAG TPA: aminopeptidase [Gemmatimonadales bacterium]|nr:aminopeptidase [Gemmatimonadales bacterium]
MLSHLLLAVPVLLLGCSEGARDARESAALGTSSEGTESSPPGDEVDYAAVARTVVTQNARVRTGDLVTLFGSPRDMQLLEDMTIEVLKAGAHPLLQTGSERLQRRIYDDVPAKFDTVTPAFGLKLAGIRTVHIGVEVQESDTAFAGVPAERLLARGKATLPITQLMNKRGVRRVFLGNGMYPTEAAARRYGMDRDELARLFWSGVNVDYSQLQATGERIRKTLAAGRELRLTNPNGTDFRMGISGRPVYVSDGVISAEDERRGGAATIVWLPAGEVLIAPVPGSAQGVIIADRMHVEGKTVERLRLEFRAGKMTSMTAQSGLERIQSFYDGAGPRKDEFGLVDIGINPNVPFPKGSQLLNWVPSGMVSIQVGNNLIAGGDNAVNFELSPFLPGSTLTVDGKAIVKDGVLQGEGGGIANR